MSYDIIYDRKFVKCGDRFLPMVSIGCSNVYVPTYAVRGAREKRARNWNCLFNRAYENPLKTIDELKTAVEGTKSSYDQNFVYRGKWIDNAGYESMILNSAKNALTLEEIIARYKGVDGVYVSIGLCSSDKYPENVRKLYNCAGGYAQTSAELERITDECTELLNTNRIEGTFPYIYCRYCGWGAEDGAELKPHVTKKRRTGGVKEALKGSEFFGIVEKATDGTRHKVLKRLTPSGFSFYWVWTLASDEAAWRYAKVFKTEKAATKWLSENEGRINYGKNNFEVVKIVKPV